MTHLPSTMALRAFEVAARRLNFTQTASVLNLTQGAVSHQIRECAHGKTDRHRAMTQAAWSDSLTF